MMFVGLLLGLAVFGVVRLTFPGDPVVLMVDFSIYIWLAAGVLFQMAWWWGYHSHFRHFWQYWVWGWKRDVSGQTEWLSECSQSGRFRLPQGMRACGLLPLFDFPALILVTLLCLLWTREGIGRDSQFLWWFAGVGGFFLIGSAVFVFPFLKMWFGGKGYRGTENTRRL